MTHCRRDVRILDWCNRVRADLGKKPRTRLTRGRRNTETQCPIAHTIGNCSVTEKRVVVGCRLFPVPKYVARWIQRFDRGEFSYLELLR